MTNKQIVLETIAFIKARERDFLDRNMLTTLWKNFTLKKQEYFKNLLLQQELIHLNSAWDFSLTAPVQLSTEDDFDVFGNCKKRVAQKDSEIVASYLETTFFKFLKENETSHSRKVNVKRFMKSNFTKPIPTSPDTMNETDEGVLFLESLKDRGFIFFKDDELGQVNELYIDANPPTIKRWFDNPVAPFKVELTPKLDDVYLLDESFPLRLPIVDTIIVPKDSQIQKLTPTQIINNYNNTLASGNIYQDLSQDNSLQKQITTIKTPNTISKNPTIEKWGLWVAIAVGIIALLTGLKTCGYI
ncbi:MAG TPA: hypothetical protein VK671_04260 [Mucilaginibacter sp.]|jgi:hypothetical protein|nr:hypothetical protein [Mucilaginibacter sp.]